MSYAYERYRFNLNDEHYSLRHYDYGDKIQMKDQDRIFYDTHGKDLLGIEEGKHGGIKSIDLSKFDMLANQARLRKKTLYCFINVYYYYKPNWTLLQASEDRDGLSKLHHAQHLIIGVNNITVKLLGRQVQRMTEMEWVNLQYKIRNLSMPEDLKLFNTWENAHPLPTIKNEGMIYED